MVLVNSNPATIMTDQGMADVIYMEPLVPEYVARIIEKEKPDAVYACMPPHHLHDVCATVIEMGRNLFIEKPPAVTTEQIRQLALMAVSVDMLARNPDNVQSQHSDPLSSLQAVLHRYRLHYNQHSCRQMPRNHPASTECWLPIL